MIINLQVCVCVSARAQVHILSWKSEKSRKSCTSMDVNQE